MSNQPSGQVPKDLQKAIDTINGYNRIPGIDPDLVLPTQCEECENWFASLPADVSFRKNNDKPTLCRSCSRMRQSQLLKERKKAYRARKINASQSI